MRRSRSIAFSFSSLLIVGALGCGGSEASDSTADSGATTDSGAIDSGAVDSRAATDSAATDTFDATPPPIDAPPGSALLRIADMLWFSSRQNIRVCLTETTTGTTTLVEPAGATSGLSFQSVTTYVPAPTGDNFVVHLVAAGSDCSAPAILASASPLDAPIVAGGSYLLALAREMGEGETATVRLFPDLPPSGGTTAPGTRAFTMLSTTSRIDVSIDFGASPLLFPSLATVAVPTSSSAGTPSPEGYVTSAGDALAVDVTLTGGSSIGHFPTGEFFTGRNTYWVTGVPVGGPIAPQVVYCHDDLSDGTFTRCNVHSVGP